MDPTRPEAGDGPEAPPPRPAWVIVLIAGLAIVVLAIVVLLLLTGGEHGPGQHSIGEGTDQVSLKSAW